MIGHVGAPGTQRPRQTIGAVPSSLVLHLGIEFGTQENNDDRQPNPNHEADASSQ
jgi:hypothetical protein